MGRRTILLVAALVVAALGTTLVFIYVNGINNRALADQKPVKVLFAKTAIQSGTSAAEAEKAGAFEQREVAANSVATGAISDIAPIQGLVALAPIFPGEQILQAKFGQPGATSGLPIPGDKLAISLQLNDPARVAGFVQPGSNVAIFVTMAPSAGTAQAGQPGQEFTRILLPRVQVIAVGPTTVTTTTSTNTRTGQVNTEQLPRAIMTLALSQADAQRVIYAQSKGALYFGLLTKDSQVGKGGVITGQNLFS